MSHNHEVEAEFEDLAAILGISDQESAEAVYVANVQDTLAGALLHRMETRGITKQMIADKLRVDKSTISRMFDGHRNLTSKSIAALCWALDVEPNFWINFHDGKPSNAPSTYAMFMTSGSGKSSTISQRPKMSIVGTGT